MTTDFNSITRKAVDVTGRLGSLYDTSSDKLIEQRSLEPCNVQKPTEQSICRVFSGAQSVGLINYLEQMDFNTALRLNIFRGLVNTTGVSSLIHYSQPINENTRFFYYSYRSKIEELIVTREKLNETIASLTYSICKIHLIFKVLWGFEILCVISILDPQSVSTVDNLLKSISDRLQNSRNEFVLTDAEKQKIVQLTNVTVYGSETCIDKSNVPFLSVLTTLECWQKQENLHHPLMYIMCSLGHLGSSVRSSEALYLSEQNNADFEKFRMTTTSIDKGISNITTLFGKIPDKFEDPVLDQQRTQYKEQFCNFLNIWGKFQDHLTKTIGDIRQNCKESANIDTILSDQYYISLEKDFETLYRTLHKWFSKVLLMKQLMNEHICYVDVMVFLCQKNIPPTPEHFRNALQYLPLKKDSFAFVLFSNDRLKEEKPDVWEAMYRQFLSKRCPEAPITSLIYADFTNCECELKHPTIVNLPMQVTDTSHGYPPGGPIQSIHSPPLQHPPKQTLPPPITEINVLLLGETGVGKSTFINAFVNYLAFDTLHQAEQSEAIVLIPVSFLTTIGDHFDEFAVKFGDVDANEDHEHQGQSVTQHCKSYVFHLNDRLILRLIDTPGMGDTRGIAQDDRNMDHILTYINNLSHLNAVCLLLKPNASRLNIFFRSCINQLFTYLTPISYNNIIFCFTNARATFFAPGDTGPLLRQMLKNEHQNGISFQKTNTFCFDSESFRYLAAKKCGIDFDDFQKEECTKSWTTSVTESVRLLQHILTREPYYLNGYQSPRKAALQIVMLARPLVETLRLITYNWVLCGTEAVTHQMILNCNPVNMQMCSDCTSSSIVPVGRLFSMRFHGVRSEINKLQPHQCTLDGTNMLIEYTVKHDFVAESPRTQSQLEGLLNDILLQCEKLSSFLQQQQLLPQDDPFAPVFERFINEEHHILGKIQDNTTMNMKVLEALTSTKEIRVKNRRRLNESNEALPLNEIYRIIEELKSVSTIKKQIDSIMESRRLKMKANEKQIKTNFASNNEIFRKLLNSFQ